MELRASLRRRTWGHWISMSQKCALTAQEANRINGSVTSRLRDMILFLYSALVRPYLEYPVQLWGPQCNKDMNLFQQVQRKAMRMIRGLEHLSYEDRLRKLGLFSLEERMFWRDLTAAFQYLQER